MKTLESLKKQITRLSVRFPKAEPEPWPPEEGEIAWCLWDAAGRPTERMSFIKMIELMAEKAWSDEGDEVYELS